METVLVINQQRHAISSHATTSSIDAAWTPCSILTISSPRWIVVLTSRGERGYTPVYNTPGYVSVSVMIRDEITYGRKGGSAVAADW